MSGDGSIRNWFDWVALRVFFRRPTALALGASARTVARIGQWRELGLGFTLELAAFQHDDGLEVGEYVGPRVGLELELGVVDLEIGLGDICAGGAEPTGYRSRHIATRGCPPFMLFEGRWIWLKVARSW